MTLSVIRSIGTLDRTGVVQMTLARIDAERFDELDVVRPGDLDECEVDVDVLLVGSKELSTTGLRRIARWRRDHPVSVAIAHLNGTAMDKAELAGAGITQSVRGPLTVAKLRAALDRADLALWDLLDAAERHGFAPAAADAVIEADEYDDEEYGDGYVEAGGYEDADEYDEADEARDYADDEYDETDVASDEQPVAAEHDVTEINEGVSTAAGRFAGVIRGVIAEVTGAGPGGQHRAPVALDPSPNGRDLYPEGPIVVPVQATDEPMDVAGRAETELAEEYDEDATDLDDVATTVVGEVDYAEDVADEESDDPSWAAAEATAEARDARIVTIASATGGCGKTFFATSAATVLARMGHQVLLVDLDLQFGEVAAALQIHHPYSIYDGLYRANGQPLGPDEFEEHLPELVCHHELGFDVLAAPRDPVLADYVGARDAGVVLDCVAAHYDVVIVDTPPSLNDVVIAALDRSDSVEVLATPDVPSLRNLTAFTDVLRRLGLEDERLRLVLNKVEADVGVTVAQANEAFGGRFRTVLPADRAVSRAVNRGTTAPASEPRSKISRAIVPAVASMATHLALTPRQADSGFALTETAQPPLRRLWRALSGGNP
ncbi:MAG TPA: AAA family ATPase [Mycobacteriales bacterium]|nr:AAA family ATPase [Mycobacteriales bacterium]